MRLLNQRLTGPQIRQFRESLLDAFDRDRFDEMLLFQLDKRRQHIALAGNMETIVLHVIQRAEDESWTAELLQAARDTDPRNLALFAFAQQFGLVPATQALESTIRATNPLFDPVPWYERLADLLPRVCRIEVQSGWPPKYGTGFLVGSDMVMTNYHVMENVILGSVPRKQVVLRFDHRVVEDGAVVNPGVEYRLAEADWLIDRSRYSDLDLHPIPGAVPSSEELDYALLRIDGQPGNDPIGRRIVQDTEAPVRGWILMPVDTYSFEVNSPLVILQHPQGAPLKIGFETQSVVGLNDNMTRVRHRTNTEKGSSGSPCFDLGWNLVALHHLGDPNFAPGYTPEHNQCVPMSAIIALLESRHKRDLLV